MQRTPAKNGREQITLETRRVVVLSTGHLRLSTRNMLEHTELEKWPVYGGSLFFGFYICTGSDAPPADAVPTELRQVLDFARGRGFDYVQFDCDAEPIDALDWYEDGETVLRAAVPEPQPEPPRVITATPGMLANVPRA